MIKPFRIKRLQELIVTTEPGSIQRQVLAAELASLLTNRRTHGDFMALTMFLTDREMFMFTANNLAGKAPA